MGGGFLLLRGYLVGKGIGRTESQLVRGIILRRRRYLTVVFCIILSKYGGMLRETSGRGRDEMGVWSDFFLFLRTIIVCLWIVLRQ